MEPRYGSSIRQPTDNLHVPVASESLMCKYDQVVIETQPVVVFHEGLVTSYVLHDMCGSGCHRPTCASGMKGKSLRKD